MSWLCQLVEELQDRLLRVEQLLDFLDVRAGRTARLVGGNWEVSDQQIAQWVPGTTLPLGNSSSYVRFKDGSLEIRGGQFDIRTGESGAHMTLDSSNMKGYNTNGNLTIDLDWTTGTIWAKSGGFGGTSGSPVIVLDDASANVFVPQPIYLGSDANGLVVGGQTAGGVPYIESTNYSAGSTGWRIDNDGNAEFNNVIVRGTIYASGGEISGGLTITSGGYIKAGTGTKDVDLDGIQIDSAELVGQSDGTDQIRIGADGKLVAGGGDVQIDENGIQLESRSSILSPPSIDPAAVQWQRSGDLGATIYGWYNDIGGTSYLMLRGLGFDGVRYRGVIDLKAQEWDENSQEFYANSWAQLVIFSPDTGATKDGYVQIQADKFTANRQVNSNTTDIEVAFNGTLEVAPYVGSPFLERLTMLNVDGDGVEIGGSSGGSEYGDLSIHGSVLLSTTIGCQVYRSTTQSIDSGTWDDPISYDTEVENTDGCWSSGNPTRLTASRDGRYVVSASFVLSAGGTDDRRVYAAIRKNGSDFVAMDMARSDAQAASVPRTITTVVELEKDEYVEVCVLHDSGSAKNIDAASTSELYKNSVSFYRIP